MIFCPKNGTDIWPKKVNNSFWTTVWTRFTGAWSPPKYKYHRNVKQRVKCRASFLGQMSEMSASFLGQMSEMSDIIFRVKCRGRLFGQNRGGSCEEFQTGYSCKDIIPLGGMCEAFPLIGVHLILFYFIWLSQSTLEVEKKRGEFHTNSCKDIIRGTKNRRVSIDIKFTYY